MSVFYVKTLIFDDGERYPVLLDRDSGQPAYMPTLYITTMIRPRNFAAKTLEAHLRAIMHLYTWANICGIDVEAKMSRCETLSIQEIDSLKRACDKSQDDLCKQLRPSAKTQVQIRKIVSLESARSTSPQKCNEVLGATSENRMRAIRDYLDWLYPMSYGQISSKSENEISLEAKRTEMRKRLSARLPSSRGRSALGKREGLPDHDIDLLLKVLNPEHPDNPWRDKSLAFRNQVIFLMLFTLGIRRGELLGLKIEDLNFQTLEVLIKRRADDSMDPRVDQPNTKTNDRKLILEKSVADLIHDYIVKHRSRIPKARRTPFLFVTHKSGPHCGNPLSIVGYNKMIEKLRERVPALPQDVTGHAMRHSWNDRFSRFIDNQIAKGKNISDAREEQMRAYMMGWSETSGTAATYTRRHVRKKANETSLEIQKKFIQDMSQ